MAGVEEVSHELAEKSPSAGNVATRAYYSFLNEGSQHGQHESHWLLAESELIAEGKLGYSRDTHP